jgi:hypothetical protein
LQKRSVRIIAGTLEQLTRGYGKVYHDAHFLERKPVLWSQHNASTGCHHQVFPTRQLHQQGRFSVSKTLFPLTIEYPGDSGTTTRFYLSVEINKGSLQYFCEMTPDRRGGGPPGGGNNEILRGSNC